MKNKKQTLNKPFKVGDKIIEFGQVYRIFKIVKKKGPQGKEEKDIHYRNYYRTLINKGLSFSIPVKNIKKTNIRRPISKKRLGKLLKEFTKMPKKEPLLNITKAKSDLILNDPFKTAQILKKLWLDKNDESTNFNKTQKGIFELSMERLREEVAFVGHLSLAKAIEKIKEALEELRNSE